MSLLSCTYIAIIFFLAGEKTYRQIGVTETIISTSFTNIVFALFSGQPVILYGATGPVLVFEKHLFSVSTYVD